MHDLNKVAIIRSDNASPKRHRLSNKILSTNHENIYFTKLLLLPFVASHDIKVMPYRQKTPHTSDTRLIGIEQEMN